MLLTHVGPHRADVDVRVNGVPAKTIVSRGQAKLIASAITLSYSAELASGAVYSRFCY